MENNASAGVFPQSLCTLFTLNSCHVLGLARLTPRSFLLPLLALALGTPGRWSSSIAPHKAQSVHRFHPSSLLCVLSQQSRAQQGAWHPHPSCWTHSRAHCCSYTLFPCSFYSSLHVLCMLTLLLLHGSEVFKGESAHGGPPEGVGLHNGLQPRPVQWK